MCINTHTQRHIHTSRYIHFTSVAKLCLTICNPTDWGMPVFPVLHPNCLPEFAQNSHSLSQWCHPTISYSVTPFSSCLLSFPASRSFPMVWLFWSGGQSIGASALVLPMNVQGWFPLGFTGLISLQSKGFSRVFYSITVQKHQLFSTQHFLCSNSYVHTWLLEKS